MSYTPYTFFANIHNTMKDYERDEEVKLAIKKADNALFEKIGF